MLDLGNGPERAFAIGDVVRDRLKRDLFDKKSIHPGLSLSPHVVVGMRNEFYVLDNGKEYLENELVLVEEEKRRKVVAESEMSEVPVPAIVVAGAESEKRRFQELSRKVQSENKVKRLQRKELVSDYDAHVDEEGDIVHRERMRPASEKRTAKVPQRFR